METVFLMFDTIALMAVIYFSYKGERTPGQPELGPFAIRSRAPELPPAAKTPSTTVRRR